MLMRLLFVLVCLIFTQTGYADWGQDLNRELKQKIEDAERNRKPRTALELLREALKTVNQEQHPGLYARMVAKIALNQAELGGNTPEEKLQALGKELEQIPTRYQGVFAGIQAVWHTRYFQNNQWRIRERTHVADHQGTLLEWDLLTLYRKTQELWQKALHDTAVQSASLSDYRDILQSGTLPHEYCPTLKTFFLHEAFKFELLMASSLPQPENVFTIQPDHPLIESNETFLNWNLPTLHEDPNFMAAEYLRQLISDANNRNSRPALANLALERLKWALQLNGSESIKKAVRQAYEKSSRIYRALPEQALFEFQLAQMENEDKDYRKALERCRKVREDWPGSHGALECRNLENEILEPSLSLQVESSISRANRTLFISFRNLKKIYVRIYEDRWDGFLQEEWGNVDEWLDEEELERLMTKTPVRQLEYSLDPGTDFEHQSAEKELPELPHGFYRIVVSTDPSFRNRGRNHLEYSSFFVSDALVLVRSRDARLEGVVVHASDGSPLEGAKLTIYSQNDNGRFRRIHQMQSSADGSFAFQAPANRNRYGLYLFMESQLGNFLWQESLSYGYEHKTRSHSRIRFFTDRSIYRPGQLVRFQGVCLDSDPGQDQYRTYDCGKVQITLRDANYQVVSELNLESDSQGLFDGEFTLPKDRVSGNWQIQAKHPSGSTRIQVEEYKRPKFEVLMDGARESFEIGETAVATGRAVAYSGSSMSGLSVRYRITREVRMPWWWRFGAIPGGSREISRGVTHTDETGNFEIPFQALPDDRVHPATRPVFTYRIRAEVLDSSGESRSAEDSLKAGYDSYQATLKASEWLKPGDQNLELEIRDLNGNPRDVSGIVRIHALKGPEKPVRKVSRQLWPWEYFYILKTGEIPQDPAEIGSWENASEIASIPIQTRNGKMILKTGLPEGAWRAELTAQDSAGKTAQTTMEFLVTDFEDTRPLAYPLAVHSATSSQVAEVGDTVRIAIGSGYEKQGYLHLSALHRAQILTSQSRRQGRMQLEIPVTESMRGGFTLQGYFVYENQFYPYQTRIEVPWSEHVLRPRLSTFRDRLKPGEQESWQIVIEKQDQKPFANSRLVATLYDASLDAFKPHNWQDFQSIFRREVQEANFASALRLKSFLNWYSDTREWIHIPDRSWPDFASELTYSFPRLFAMPHTMRMMRKSVGGMPEVAMMMADGMESFSSFASAAPAPMAQGRAPAEEKREKDSEEPSDSPSQNAPSAPMPRSDLRETAFFMPSLKANEKGEISLNFSMPEALTRWKLMLLALGQGAESGLLTTTVITQKDLMIEPNLPRFLTQGDQLVLAAKVSNLSETDLDIHVEIQIHRAWDQKDLGREFGLRENQKIFIKAGRSASVMLPIQVPSDLEVPVRLTLLAHTENLSDGESTLLPIMPSRMLVKESIPLSVRGPTRKNMQFEKLLFSDSSPTLHHEKLVLQMSSSPAWYAIQALPYLNEGPIDTADEAFSRIFANSMGSYIVSRYPQIQGIMEQWKGTDALLSNLEKSEDLKDVILEETPWVMEAQSESEAKARVAHFLDKNRLSQDIQSALEKLKSFQLESGAWPWCPGGRPSYFTTLMIVGGFARLRELKAIQDVSLAQKAISWLDQEMVRRYEEILQHNRPSDNHLGASEAYLLYVRSLYLQDRPLSGRASDAWNYWISQARKYAIDLPSRQAEAYAALAMMKIGEREIAQRTYDSLRERSVLDDEMGRYWRDQESYSSWHRAPIEAQAYMIELFEVMGSEARDIEDLKVWLLKQKQTQNWGTQRGTSEAVYALMARGADLLASREPVEVFLGGQLQTPKKVEAGTGFYEVRIAGRDVHPAMGEIVLSKPSEGIAWGGLHWQYFEDVDRITSHNTSALSLKREMYVERQTSTGLSLIPLHKTKTRVGDTLVSRLILQSDRDLEYVHMKDPRGSGLEPVEVLSSHKYRDGLAYYEVTRDTATHYFLEYLPKGTFVFETRNRVFQAGEYLSRPALIQCHYAPEFSAHTAGFRVEAGPASSAHE